MVDLEFKHTSTVQEMSETILVIEGNEDVVLIEDEKKTPDGLVLKELPKNLRYAFLGENGTKPMIFSSILDANMEQNYLMYSRRICTLLHGPLKISKAFVLQFACTNF